MALPSWGNSLSLSQIRQEFNGTTQASLSQFYAGKGLVPAGTIGYPNGIATAVPSSGLISISNFYGAVNKLDKLYHLTAGSGFTGGSIYFSLPNSSWVGRKYTVYIIAGGGGGGFAAHESFEGGGGGGAGGVLVVTGTVNNTSWYISGTVGAGGLGGTPASTISSTIRSTNGSNTTIFISGLGSYTAIGGGAGACAIREFDPFAGWNYTTLPGLSGGSGGGGCGYFNINRSGGSGTSGQGTAGAAGNEDSFSGGGGGKNGSGGRPNGGTGMSVTFGANGTRTFAGGGGAGGGAWAGAGTGSRGGGNGGYYTKGSNATGHSGGGGGGSGNFTSGGRGASGSVYVYFE